jgi:hypothetical protein
MLNLHLMFCISAKSEQIADSNRNANTSTAESHGRSVTFIRHGCFLKIRVHSPRLGVVSYDVIEVGQTHWIKGLTWMGRRRPVGLHCWQLVTSLLVVILRLKTQPDGPASIPRILCCGLTRRWNPERARMRLVLLPLALCYVLLLFRRPAGKWLLVSTSY